jgi:hypothetical protein
VVRFAFDLEKVCEGGIDSDEEHVKFRWVGSLDSLSRYRKTGIAPSLLYKYQILLVSH